jgi:hypothetical protein
MPAIKGVGRGHPCRRPVNLHADKGHVIPRVRRHLHRRGITARIARIGRDSSQRLGRHRWVVEHSGLTAVLQTPGPALRPQRHDHHRAGPPGGHPQLRS